MRLATLNTLKGGINRLRIKGGAAQNVLYDLKNGYVTADGSAVSRPGTVSDHILPAGTKGLCQHQGKLQVFASTVIAPGNAKYVVNVLRHPTNGALVLAEIHFAEPFLGYLYVVAEFNDGSVWHYWLQATAQWQASTHYAPGALVQPSAPNGYAYEATRLSAAGIPWAPNVARALGDKVEPTVPNRFEYTVVDVDGPSPKSGIVEPAWPTTNGATVYEDTGRTPAAPPSSTPPGTTVPPDTTDRYGKGLGGNDNVATQAL